LPRAAIFGEHYNDVPSVQNPAVPLTIRVQVCCGNINLTVSACPEWAGHLPELKSSDDSMNPDVQQQVEEHEELPVIYCFRFDNGRSKVGLTTNMRSRARDYHKHGINGCKGVGIVACESRAQMRRAEKLALEVFADDAIQYGRETFQSISDPVFDLAKLVWAVEATQEPREVNPVLQARIATLRLTEMDAAKHYPKGSLEEATWDIILRVKVAKLRAVEGRVAKLREDSEKLLRKAGY
jgi:hypothetical protein